jgi:molecular chaperone GrpE
VTEHAKPDEQASRGEIPEDLQDAEREQRALPAEPLVPADEDEEAIAEGSEVGVLQEELSLLETQLQSMRDRYIRAVADLENARKRARQAIAEARTQGTAGVLADLLVLVDNFERALGTSRPVKDAPQETRAIYEGVDLIYRQLMQLLQRQGVGPIEAVGEIFDPGRHEAVAQIPASEGQKEGTVALETQKGYMMGDRVLRPSKVGVVVSLPGGTAEGD